MRKIVETLRRCLLCGKTTPRGRCVHCGFSGFRKLTLAIALALMVPATASAQRMPCHDAAEITKQLADKHEEAPVALGLQSNGNLMMIYASKEKDTWTLVSTTPAGMSCIVASGKRLEMLPYLSHDPIA